MRIATLQLLNPNLASDVMPDRDTSLADTARYIAQAVQDGTELVVLPAYFNGMLTYDERLALQAEMPTGTTYAFLREQAQKHSVYLAGAFLIADSGDVWQSAFIVAPDGQVWRYDAQRPFLWERAYFRGNPAPHIAHTPLGRIGILLAWDGAYPETWAQLAGRVDMVVVMGAVPDAHSLALLAPDDSTTIVNDLGFVMRYIALHASGWVNQLNMQAQWLRVPIVCAGLSGQVVTHVPAPRYSTQILCLERSDLRQTMGDDVRLRFHLKRITQIIGADGQPILRSGSDGVDILHADIPLPAVRPVPMGTPPHTGLPVLLRWWVFPLFEAGLTLNYRRIARRQWGARMAQTTASTLWWRAVLVLVSSMMFLLGLLLGKRK
jgi:predicted amidohydrolase